MANDPPPTSLGQELLHVPFPDMVKSMGLAIAEAQYELDVVGMRLAQMMSGEYSKPDPNAPTDATKEIKVNSTIHFGGQPVSPQRPCRQKDSNRQFRA